MKWTKGICWFFMLIFQETWLGRNFWCCWFDMIICQFSTQTQITNCIFMTTMLTGKSSSENMLSMNTKRCLALWKFSKSNKSELTVKLIPSTAINPLGKTYFCHEEGICIYSALRESLTLLPFWKIWSLYYHLKDLFWRIESTITCYILKVYRLQ